MPQNKKYKRLPPEIKLSFRLLEINKISKIKKPPHFFLNSTESLENGTVFIDTDVVINEGIIVELALVNVTNRSRMCLLAEVEWVDPKGIGVRLMKASKEVYLNVIANAKRGTWQHRRLSASA